MTAPVIADDLGLLVIAGAVAQDPEGAAAQAPSPPPTGSSGLSLS